MKTFKLNRVKYRNIMSVGQVSIDIQLDKVQKTLITGKNGGGKSTMLEAITFALFGKPFRDIKKGQLINSINKKDLLVELWMEYDGHSFYIKRGQKPNVFTIERDGVQLDEAASTKDFQAYFEGLIGMSLTSFKQIVVLGTAGYTPFMGLTTPNRRKLVEDLLEVSILAVMDKLNKASIRDINQQVQVVDLKKDHVQDQIRTHQEYAEKQKKAGEENIARYQKMYDEFVQEALGHKAAIERINDEILNIVFGDDPSETCVTLDAKYHELTSRMTSYSKVIGLYEKGGSCPTCLQQLNAEGDVVQRVHNHAHECETARDKIDNERIALNELRDTFNQQKQQAQSLKRDIQGHKDLAITAVNKAKRIKAGIEELTKEFIDNSEEVEKLTAEHNECVRIKTDLVMEKYHRGIITDMLKDSGIKGAIIKKYVPLFNKQINYYLKIMEADYVFTLDEEFNETIKSRGREDFSYASFSQGEKARIDIALLFTWRDIASRVSGVNISALFLDEVFDSATDVEGVKAISTILNDMKDANIFIISHRDHDPQAYGQHLQMVKKGRFTICL